MVSKNKKGVSPVIATVLLISIAVIIVIIIFIWATTTIREGQLKFGSPIKNSCGDLNIELSLSGNSLDIINKGSRIPLHTISIKVKEGSSTIPYECDSLDVSPGQTANINDITDIASCGVPSEGEVSGIVPIIKDDNSEKYYCDDEEITDF